MTAELGVGPVRVYVGVRSENATTWADVHPSARPPSESTGSADDDASLHKGMDHAGVVEGPLFVEGMAEALPDAEDVRVKRLIRGSYRMCYRVAVRPGDGRSHRDFGPGRKGQILNIDGAVLGRWCRCGRGLRDCCSGGRWA